MKSEIFKIAHDDGSFQKFQVISGFSWSDVHYFSPGLEPKTIHELVRLYKVNIIPKFAKDDDGYVFFGVPSVINIPFDRNRDIGYVYDDGILLKNLFESEFEKGNIFVRNGKVISSNNILNNVLQQLYDANFIEYCENIGNQIKFICINDSLGFISSNKSSMCVNSHFFLMDPTDMDSPYCKLGTPHGFSLENGIVKTPPLNHRKLLLVDKCGKASISRIELNQMSFVIDGREYIPGINCTLHFRPDEYMAPVHQGSDLIITEDKVVSIKDGGGSIIPVAGFVLSLDGVIRVNDTKVIYKGFEDYVFAAQVGPELVVDGMMREDMDFPFFDERKDDVIYAPTVYPLPYESARAARICLGTDSSDNPVVIWAEGAGKLGINPDDDSTGASLLEMAQFCFSQGYRNIINLDGGGSAQILYDHSRQLKIADRLPVTNKECERPVPNGIMIL